MEYTQIICKRQVIFGKKRTQVSGDETQVEGGFSDVPHTWYNHSIATI